MKIKKYLILFFALVLTSCNQSQTANQLQDSAKATTSVTNTQRLENVESGSNPTETMELLQGTWQHVEDPTNYLVFEKNLRKEIAGDMTAWDEEEFVLSDKCLNKSDKEAVVGNEKGKYISCLKSDLCWFVEEVDKDNLVLSYISRGNFLTYRRVKSRDFSQKFKVIDSLENKYQSCLDKGQNMLGCANTFYGQMDSLLNLQYKKLLNKLGAAEGTKFKNEQRLWLGERDKQFVLFKQQVHKEAVDNGFDGGQDEQMILTERKAMFVKQRVIELLTVSVPAQSQYP